MKSRLRAKIKVAPQVDHRIDLSVPRQTCATHVSSLDSNHDYYYKILYAINHAWLTQAIPIFECRMI